MKRVRLIYLVLLCTLTTILITSNAFATTYYSNVYGYQNATVDIDNYTYLFSPYFTNTANAVYSWNNCGLTSRSISPDTSSSNKVYQIAESETWPGLYEPLVYDTSRAQTRSYFTSQFRIILNTNQLGSLSDTYKQRAACHELGHALGLDHNDNPTDPAYTIMRSTIYNSVSTPQTYDKNAVNSLWPNW